MSRPDDAVRIVLDLLPMADSIRGTMHDIRGQTLPFYGWLELSALLDDVRPRTLSSHPEFQEHDETNDDAEDWDV